jgi:aryl-alcohol dehydrogenase-like predicted oxidoreductase
MNHSLLGRTNREFPHVWLSFGQCAAGEAPAIAEAALASGLPMDVTGQLGLWGGLLRGAGVVISYRSTTDIERSTSRAHAFDLIQAELIQVLSSIGRDHVDFYFFSLRRRLEDFQLEGAIEALDSNREDGVIKYLGFNPKSSPVAALSTWQFNDAFDVVMLPVNAEEDDLYCALAPLAKTRRVGIVGCRPDANGMSKNGGHPVLVEVTSAAQIGGLL